MMATPRCDHPDIGELVTAKEQPGRLYHCNLSVRVTDPFIAAVRQDSEWLLVVPASGVDGEGEPVEREWTGGSPGPPVCRVMRRLPVRALGPHLARHPRIRGAGALFVHLINLLDSSRYCERISATNPSAPPTVSYRTMRGRVKMSKDYREMANEVVAGIGALRQGAREAVKAFGALAAAATATNALDSKTKELMALAIGIAMRCEGCIAYHARAAHGYGATRQEVLETVALALYMGGGPAAVLGADAIRAYDQFSQPK
jgi:AhpD family alkylhydroperoxidase